MLPSQETGKILCVGLLNLDVISTLEYFPLEDTGQRYLIVNLIYSGPLHNEAAVSKGRQLLRLHCVASIVLDRDFASMTCHTRICHITSLLLNMLHVSC